MADWDGLRRGLENSVVAPPLTALRTRHRQRRQRRTIAVACTVGMVGTATGVALLGRAAERGATPPQLAARPTGNTDTLVNGDRAPSLGGDHEEHVVTDVDFVSPTTGWAIGVRCEGDACDIATFRTDDGGRTWGVPLDVALRVPRSSFHEEDPRGGAVRSIKMVDRQRGYVFNPDLYTTADGGLTWQRVPRPSKATSVSVAGESVWVTERGCPRDADCDLLLRAGAVGGPLADLDVPDTNGALAVVRREGATGGYLLSWDAPEEPRAALHATRDAGRTWQRRTHPCPDATAASLSAGDGRPLWVVCTTPAGRRAYTSSDAGASWSPAGSPPRDGEVTDLAAWTADDAYLTLQNPGRLLVTHDRGRTWRPATGTAAAFGYANLDVVSPTHAFATGDEGDLWRTTDGRRWERLDLPPGAARATASPSRSVSPAPRAKAPADEGVEFTGLSFVDPRNGWALGRTCAERRCRLVLRRTSDGGETWRVANAPALTFEDEPRLPGNVHSVTFADERNGFLYGSDFLVTHDGGATWRRLGGNVTDVVVRDGYVWRLWHDTCASQDCYSYADRAPIGSDRFTGAFEREQSPVLLARLAVADRDTAYLAGNANEEGNPPVVFATSDGGRSWARRPAPCAAEPFGHAHGLYPAAARGDLWVMCAYDGGGSRAPHRSAHSADGGRTWREHGSDQVGRLSFFVALSPLVGWRADSGPAEGIRVTRDGGRTWRGTPAPLPGLGNGALAFQMLDETHGFALFSEGVVARTTDGRTWQRMTRP